MWSTKDLASIVIMAVLGFVSTALVAQMAGLITGIPGANYIFTIILAIVTSFSFLLYEGRRWRFFVQMAIFGLLVTPTYLGGPPFQPIKVNFAITAVIADAVVNSYYATFSKREKLKWWAILSALVYWTMLPFIGSLLNPLFFPPEYVRLFINAVLFLTPVIVVEAIAGGYLGYRIYCRVKPVDSAHPVTHPSLDSPGLPGNAARRPRKR